MQNIEKKNVSKKTITQDNVYMIRQFAYVHRIAMILLFIKKKNTRCHSIVLI